CCARAPSGHAAAPPSSVMHSRRFNGRCLPCFQPEDSTARNLLHCGISSGLIVAMGQPRSTWQGDTSIFVHNAQTATDPVCHIELSRSAINRRPPMREPRNRVVQVRRFGAPDGLEVVDAPLPTAGRGEVRVRVLASSVEYTDITIRRHLYPWVLRRPPF